MRTFKNGWEIYYSKTAASAYRHGVRMNIKCENALDAICLMIELRPY